MPFEYNDHELLVYIDSLSPEVKKLLASRLRENTVEQMFYDIKTAIAIEAKNRIQSKIVTTFIHGYASGALFESIYYTITESGITLSSTKSYFDILNAGFASFDMKEAWAGKTVKMRLPGGAVVYRKVAAKDVQPNTRKKTLTSSRWVHPGWRGVHIYEQVAKEMELWVKEYVRDRIQELIREASTPLEQYSMTAPGDLPTYNQSSNFIGK